MGLKTWKRSVDMIVVERWRSNTHTDQSVGVLKSSDVTAHVCPSNSRPGHVLFLGLITHTSDFLALMKGNISCSGSSFAINLDFNASLKSYPFWCYLVCMPVRCEPAA